MDIDLLSLRRFAVLAGAFCACLHACGSSASSRFSDAGVSGEGGQIDGALPDGALLSDGALFGDVSTCGSGCSADLKSVVDCHGNVLTTCSNGQGCASGACTAACTAAAASHGSVGCSYVVPTPPSYVDDLGACFAVFVTNNWTTPSTVTITRSGTTYDPTMFGRVPNTNPDPTTWPALTSTGIAPGQVVVLFLSHSADSMTKEGLPTSCAVTPAIEPGVDFQSTGVGNAWVITTSAPVSAYDTVPFGGALSAVPSGELILPTSAWGTNYVAALPAPGTFTSSCQNGGAQWGQIVAASDGTTVTLVSPVALSGSANVPAAPANTPTTYTLDAGQFVQFWPSCEMSGALMQSNKPIAFVGGNSQLGLKSATSTGGGSEAEHEQAAPVSALDSEFAVAPYETRRSDLQPESVPYRMVGVVKGTTLTFDPPISGAPATLDVGQVADFEVVGPFVVKSQDANHPFSVGQMMSGCYVTSGSRPGAIHVFTGVPVATPNPCLGDEEYLALLPPKQFLPSYVFFTDPTYPTTNLVVTRVKSNGAFEDVTVDCLGTLGGWQSLGTSGDYEYTTVDLVRANVPVGTCQNGPHQASSKGTFGLVVWGMGELSSYAYPAGGSFSSINTVVVPVTQ